MARGSWKWGAYGLVFLGGLLLVLGLGGPRVGASAPRARAFQPATPGTHHAGLVIRYGDGHVETYCIAFDEPEITGVEVLERSGVPVIIDPTSSFGQAVCKIDGEGCNFPQEDCFCRCQQVGQNCEYWAYYHLRDGQWEYSGQGAGTYLVHDGDVEGWAWGSGSPGHGAEPPLYTFEALCLPPTATWTPTATPTPSPTPTPTATATPTTTPLPTPTPHPTLPPTPTPTPTVPPTSTPTPTRLHSQPPSRPSRRPSPTATPTWTPSPTFSPTATRTPSPSVTPTPSATPTPTRPRTPTPGTGYIVVTPPHPRGIPLRRPTPARTPEDRTSPPSPQPNGWALLVTFGLLGGMALWTRVRRG